MRASPINKKLRNAIKKYFTFCSPYSKQLSLTESVISLILHIFPMLTTSVPLLSCQATYPSAFILCDVLFFSVFFPFFFLRQVFDGVGGRW